MTTEERKAEDARFRQEYPLFAQYPELIYLDNAATTQKPSCVIQAESAFYEKYNANPFRGVYELAEFATEHYEEARAEVAKLLHANADEIVFTRNASESLNLIAYSLGNLVLRPGDEVLVSIMEHHSNLLVWQQAAKRTGATLRYLDCTQDGKITAEMVEAAITDKTKIFAVTQISNVLGWKNEIKSFAEICHRKGCLIVADGAQSVPHIEVDVKALDVDFLAFSGHKMMGPMGIGALYGKKELLESMPPFLFGGEMIDTVTREGAVYAPVPHKFEAGTVNAAGAVGLMAAIRYLKEIGFDTIERREAELTQYAVKRLLAIPGVHILGSQDPSEHHSIVTFLVDNVHPHDVASILDMDHIAVRAGHHCAQPLLQHLNTSATTRASFAFYNTMEEVDALAESLAQVRRRMGYVD